MVQAAIAACHALAPSYAATNWDAVISWYDVLPGLAGSPVARLNRAAAVAERVSADDAGRSVRVERGGSVSTWDV